MPEQHPELLAKSRAEKAAREAALSVVERWNSQRSPPLWPPRPRKADLSFFSSCLNWRHLPDFNQSERLI
jgi:hypothetical protein